MAPPSLEDQGRELIDLIERDTELPLGIRHAAGSERALLLTNPDRVLQHLEELADRVRPSLPVSDPTSDMAKCLGIENFWAFYLDPDVKLYFDDSETYRRRVESSPNPQTLLMRDTRTLDPLIDGKFSWMVTRADINGISGPDLKQALEIRQDPPYVVIVLTEALLRSAGVRVRKPRAVDAVYARLTEWRSTGPASGVNEWIDADIPRRALGSIEWRQ